MNSFKWICCTRSVYVFKGLDCCCFSGIKLWRLFVTLWVVACQAPLASAISQSLFKCTSVMLSTISSPATHFSCCLPSFPASRTFPASQLYASGGQRIGASVLASVLPMNIQGWFPLGLTGLISLQFKGLSRIISSTIIWNHQFFSTQPSL